MVKKPASVDPMEKMIADALDAKGIEYVTENDPLASGLDFYLPNMGIHIEVKQFHSDRIGKQMSRAENVIAVQGRKAVMALADMIYTNMGDLK